MGSSIGGSASFTQKFFVLCLPNATFCCLAFLRLFFDLQQSYDQLTYLCTSHYVLLVHEQLCTMYIAQWFVFRPRNICRSQNTHCCFWYYWVSSYFCYFTSQSCALNSMRIYFFVLLMPSDFVISKLHLKPQLLIKMLILVLALISEGHMSSLYFSFIFFLLKQIGIICPSANFYPYLALLYWTVFSVV